VLALAGIAAAPTSGLIINLPARISVIDAAELAGIAETLIGIS